MANVAHSALAGADLHEPKGIGSAAANTVYVANGSGTGTWSSLSSVTGRTGEIFMWGGPLAPSGSLECDGSAVSRTTYATLFAAISVSSTGSRTNGSAIITGLASTTGLTTGIPVSGTGIPAATTISTVDSATQVTLSANATSTGSATVVFAPHGIGDGSTTFNLPTFTDTGRYPRSRIISASTDIHLGKLLANAVKAHTHGGTSDNANNDHTHVFTTSGVSANHTHTYTLANADTAGKVGGLSASTGAGGNVWNGGSLSTSNTSTISADHTHSGTTGGMSATHQHAFTTSTQTPAGGTETRPDTSVVVFCIKT